MRLPTASPPRARRSVLLREETESNLANRKLRALKAAQKNIFTRVADNGTVQILTITENKNLYRRLSQKII